MTTRPEISVIMPCYNSKKYLAKSIGSILDQTYRNFEFIIIDDCSTDGSDLIIKEFQKKDNRIVYLKNEKNLGVALSLNAGIKISSGKYIARMDADDISLDSRLEKQYEFMESKQDCIVCGTNINLIDQNDSIIGSRYYYESDEKIKRKILNMSPFAHPTVIIRKEVLITNEIYYSDKYPRAEDYYLWLRLVPYGSFNNLNQKMFNYRISESSIKSLYLKQTLKDTISLKIKHIKYGDMNSYLILFLEILLYMFPKKVVMRLYKFKYRK